MDERRRDQAGRSGNGERRNKDWDAGVGTGRNELKPCSTEVGLWNGPESRT